jgi:predicted nuclease with TOPRIM domain
LRETVTKIQLVVAMIGTVPRYADINSSAWESMGHLRSKLGEVKEQVEDGFKEMADLHKKEKATSGKLMDLAVSFDNLANSYSKNCRAIKEKLSTLEQRRREASSNGYLLLYWSNPVSQVLRAMAFKRTTRRRSNFGELMTVQIS